MSKELVVSATRHETRVAVLEDDSLVEIFYQREKEYSLAGSIHKGRVTRVLPGMQSAFVDIGLERDAFLYVSDFFEDNEEYDKIVSGVEEKVARLDKGLPPAPEPSPSSSPMDTALETGTLAVPSSNQFASAPRSDRPERSRDDRQRGGRGRRRGRRGSDRPQGSRESGGLPDSKYASARDLRSDTPAYSRDAGAPSPEPEAASPSDIVVLPGESLAKYIAEPAVPITREELEELQPLSDSEGYGIQTGAEEAESESKFAAADLDGEPNTQFAGEETLPEDEQDLELAIDSEVDSEIDPDTDVNDEQEDSPEAAFAVTGISVEEATVVILAESGSADEDDIEEESQEEDDDNIDNDSDAPLSFSLEIASIDTASDSDLTGDVTGDLTGDTTSDVAAENAEDLAASGDESPEPARVPTSLTAALREQNPQYQHRVSRRMRRKSRGGEPEPRTGLSTNQASGTAEVSAPETRLPLENRNREERRPRDERAPREGREERQRPPLPSISELLREGQEIIVQIAKEPIGQKGARITSHVALPGRFLVYMPSVDHIGVSRKIPSEEERLRLKHVLQANRAGIPGGFIVRTAGEGKTEEELRADMMFLYNLWLDMRQKAERRPAPQLMHHDLDVVQRILRDQLTSAFKTVWVDNEVLYESILSFVQRFQPGLVSRVKLYTRATPIFDEFGITSELEKALRPKVWLKSGGYIVINQTEALVAIDINTGKFVGKSNRLEDTIVKTNTDAIKEIVRQIRLRDLGGIIVVDFIDMDERKNKQKVMQALEEAMRVDRAPYKILQFNDFGLVAITRKRVKQSLERTLCTPCPYCEGAGSVKSVQTVISEILSEANKMAGVLENDVMLRVHPEVAKVLKSSHNDYLQEIEETLGKTVMVKSDPQLHQTKFDLV